MNIVFSLVLYKHRVSDITPLLSSISSLSCILCSTCDLNLYIFDNSLAPDIDILSLREHLVTKVSCHLSSDRRNIGFGKGHNYNFSCASTQVSGFLSENSIFCPVNPDTSFDHFSISDLLSWFTSGPCICCAPLIYTAGNHIQYTAKRNPSFLSLLLGRFPWLRSAPVLERYYSSFINLDRDYRADIFQADYLSGCFLFIKSLAYEHVNGFSPEYFLHLEDADLTRKLSNIGTCVHCPIGIVYHRWARGSHKSFSQTFHLMCSYIAYTRKWGFSLS